MKRMDVYRKIEHTDDESSGKLLDYETKRKFFWVRRTRGEVTAYFKVVVRGNSIRAYKTTHTRNGKTLNAFTSMFIPALCGEFVGTSKIVTTTVLLFKLHIKDVDRFDEVYRKHAPELFPVD
jgi:hypothetical protein